jgi:penicillin-binding protein 2
LNYDIKEALKNFFKSRLFVLAVVFIVLFGIIFMRIFTLQVINGKSYQENFSLKIQRTQAVEAARGNIYDKNGVLLAYNELAYTVSIYSSNDEDDESLNAELAEILEVLDANGETLVNDFKISLDDDGTYEFNVSGSSLITFRLNVFGRSSESDLQYNSKIGLDEANATAEQIMEYLMSENKFDVDSSYSPQIAYEIVVVRFAMNENRFAQYKDVEIATDVSDKSVAYINEHMDSLTGISVNEDMIRKYNYSEYFSAIIGYTGRISDSEYEELSAENDSYTTNDTVGKSGLEQYYETYLRGKNGERKFYIDSVGRITEVISNTDSVAGNDLYLSIDAKLQKAAYLALEQEIAGIVYSNIKKGNIPISDVYSALVENGVIDIEHLAAENASETEKEVEKTFEARRKQVLKTIKRQLNSSPVILNNMSDEVLDEFTYIISMLKDDGILLSDEIDENDSTYKQWRNHKISPKEYLTYCISQHWIDISMLEVDDKYADSSEIYSALCDYIIAGIKKDSEFSKIIYQYMVQGGSISPRSLCIILFDQEVLNYDADTVSGLKNGTISPYDFIMKKINNIEITPAQLALEPCTGSCIITDTDTGELLAMVSYPGYDNNRLANGVDEDYYEALRTDRSNPLYNYATQERTAPGSTFKMVTSTAGLAENIINTSSKIQCTGIFTDISNHPKCWAYPSTHGKINVSQALRDSCNVFYYTLGYRLAQKGTGVYNDDTGISFIQKYAGIYGLDEKSGVEIEENTSEIADEYPVMAAIGQSNNNITTSALSRYVTAVTSGKLYNYQLMSKIVDSEGNIVESYTPEYEDISSTLTNQQWSAIRSGMRLVGQTLESFDGFDIAVAGKTGTAQQTDHANHALFVGYAPYDNPEISIAIRIANGYSSHNAAFAARNIISYYYGEQTLKQILSQKASGVNGSSTNTVTD